MELLIILFANQFEIESEVLLYAEFDIKAYFEKYFRLNPVLYNADISKFPEVSQEIYRF